MRTLIGTVRRLFAGRRDAEMSAELAAHVDALTERNIARGMPPDEARYAAFREFGGVEQIKERCRDERQWVHLETGLRDLREAVRSLLRTPGYTSVCVFTLCLGIGLSTAAFSLTNALLYQSLPYPEPTQLVRIFRVSRNATSLGFAPANYLDLARSTASLGQSAWYTSGVATLGIPAQATQQFTGLTVSANFLTTLDVQPTLGRGFRSDADQPDHSVVIISHRLWANEFASDPQVIGRTVRLDGESATVIGILPESFQTMAWGKVDFVRSISLTPEARADRKSGWLHVIARMKPGVTVSALDAELAVIADGLDREYPAENGHDTFRAVHLLDSGMPPAGRAILWLVTGLAALVLAIACANLAAVQFARALRREREYAIRAALGASRWRLVSPNIFESLLISVLGSAVGLFLARYVAGILERQVRTRADFPEFRIPIDQHVLLFLLGATMIATLAFGFAPAWLAMCRTTNDALKQTTHAVSLSRRHTQAKHALVLVQIAVATVVITTGAAFYVASHHFLQRDLGWSMDGLFTAGIGLPPQRYAGDQSVAAFQRKLVERLSALPGVECVALTRALPLWSLGDDSRLMVEGRTQPDVGRESVAMVYSVTANYFSTVRIALIQGRGFANQYAPDAPRVAIVNESLARHFWPGKNPIGKRLRLDGGADWLEVIGVTADVRMAIEFTPPRSSFLVYRPLDQAPLRYFRIAVRMSVEPESIAPAIRRALAQLDPDLPLFDPLDLRKGIIASSPFRLVNAAQPAFIAMALIIAVLGVYATLAQFAVQRTRDFGIRLALGARPYDILALVLLHGGRLIAVGGVIGVLGAFAIGRLLQHAMPEFGMPGLPFELEILAGLGAITLAASYVPARRASRVDPVDVLRAE